MSTREAVSGERSIQRSAKFARSGQMMECLRGELLYSEKRPRDLLFAAIETLVRERPPMMVSQITRESVLLAKDLGEAAGFAFDKWETAGKVVMKSLIMAEALLTVEGTPIALDVAAQAAVVGGIRDDYRDRTEAFLLAFVIGRLGDVTTRDHMALAHALFRQFDRRVSRDELEDRVVVLLARLADRIALNGDVYHVLELARA